MKIDVKDGLTVRKAGPADINLIRSMAEIAFPATYKGIITESQIVYMMEWMYSPDNLRKQMEEGHVYYMAFDNDVPVGYVSVQQDDEDLFHLHKIYVLPGYQGRGYGNILFKTAISHVKKSQPGRCRIELNVNRDNKALGFYQRLGMSVIRQGDFDIGNGFYMNDYIMGIEV